MRILIHSNAPWAPSGYGRQCALLIKIFTKLGHHVTVSAINGLDGAAIDWNGTTILPKGKLNFGVDTLVGHANAVQADLVLTLMDSYQLWPIREALRELNLACWVPIDTDRLGRPDEEMLKGSGARPIAMSDHGAQALAKAGWPGAMIAHHMHSVDMATYEAKKAERDTDRMLTGVHGKFVIGICAANHDQFRKSFPEQLEAYRRFTEAIGDGHAVMRIHTLASGAGSGLNLIQLAHRLGLDGKVEFSDHYPQVAGLFDDQLMNDWFSQLDVLSNCAHGEGFGVTMLEAQAMGTPVIATRASAMRDAYRAQWLVDGEPFWNFHHEAWWTKPSIDAIVKAYHKAYRYAGSKREMVRDRVEGHHWEMQVERWEQILKELEPRA